jgi:hypothetical protein
MIHTERANASMSASWYTLLLPEPLGPATIQKIGRSPLARDAIGRPDDALVLAPRLGNVPGEYVAQVLVEARAVRVQGMDRLRAAFRVGNLLLAYSPGGRRPPSVQALVDDLCHAAVP